MVEGTIRDSRPVPYTDEGKGSQYDSKSLTSTQVSEGKSVELWVAHVSDSPDPRDTTPNLRHV